MTLAGKVLVVANLLLSLMFVGYAVMTHATRLDLPAELGVQKQRTAALTTLQTARTETRDRLAKQLEKIAADTAVAEKDAKAEETRLTDQESQLREDIRQRTETVAARAAEVTESNAKLVALRKSVEQKRDELASLKGDVNKRTAVRTATADQLAQTRVLLSLARDRSAGLARRVAELDSK